MAPPLTQRTDGLPIIKGIQLIGTYQLPDRIQPIFPFPVFNAVQSKCFQTVYRSDDNFVLSAPTGSGKTAILELAICRLAATQKTSCFKIVYQAPTKSLCSERQRDWSEKFKHLNLKCAELTGDTERGQLKQVQQADILVTTPEKWDSITRRWRDHRKLMDLVRLFLIDEVHILKDDRGSSLEAAVSRMKTSGSDVRFVALSATVPNSEDISTWLGRNVRVPGMPAAREVFGEEFRPVKVQKHVVGIQFDSGNDFAFDGYCTRKLPEIISEYGTKPKPIMVFCMTRKSTETTAQALAQWWTESAEQERYWNEPKLSKVKIFENTLLRGLAEAGVAFHHAGLNISDRLKIEQAYLNGDISVICCTSTLAVGVNLPCYMAVIKNTVSYQDNGTKEYSDIETMQMIGRAGRSQFERAAVAVLMTRVQKVTRYEKMVSGTEILESRLHLNLIEHLNAEVSLSTIKDLATAKTWLEGTYFHVRYRKNPQHYQLQIDSIVSKSESNVESVCRTSLDLLREFEMITPSDRFKSTAIGDAMARYYIQFDTMKLILGLQPKARTSELLSAIAQSAELRSVRFRASEKQILKEINSSNSIKFPIPVDIALAPHKISLIIQGVLGGLDARSDDMLGVHRQQFLSDQALIFQHIHRLIRCIIDCSLYRGDSVTIRNALELARGLASRCWDDSPLQMMQLDSIGPVAVRKLLGAEIKCIEEMECVEPQTINTILSKHPPFGTKLIQSVKCFPKLWISLKALNQPPTLLEPGSRLSIDIKVEIGFLNDLLPVRWKGGSVMVHILVETSDGRIAHFSKLSAEKIGVGHNILVKAEFTGPQQVINCYVACEDIAGTLKSATLNPKIPASRFAVPPDAHRGRVPAREYLHGTAQAHSDVEDFEDADINDIDLVDAIRTGNTDVQSSGRGTPRPGQQQANDSRKRKPNDDSISFDEATNSTRKLPNGKWECQHKCQDKQTCRHLCCREGMDSKPRLSKKKKSEQEQIANKNAQTNQVSPINKFFSHSKQQMKSQDSDEKHDNERTGFWDRSKPITVEKAHENRSDDNFEDIDDVLADNDRTAVENLNLDEDIVSDPLLEGFTQNISKRHLTDHLDLRKDSAPAPLWKASPDGIFQQSHSSNVSPYLHLAGTKASPMLKQPEAKGLESSAQRVKSSEQRDSQLLQRTSLSLAEPENLNTSRFEEDPFSGIYFLESDVFDLGIENVNLPTGKISAIETVEADQTKSDAGITQRQIETSATRPPLKAITGATVSPALDEVDQWLMENLGDCVEFV